MSSTAVPATILLSATAGMTSCSTVRLYSIHSPLRPQTSSYDQMDLQWGRIKSTEVRDVKQARPDTSVSSSGNQRKVMRMSSSKTYGSDARESMHHSGSHEFPDWLTPHVPRRRC